MFQLNELVLAKLGKSVPWPAKIIHDLGDNKYQVKFYGTYQSAVINAAKINKYNQTTEKSLIPESSIRYNDSLRKAVNEIRKQNSQVTLKMQINDSEQSLAKCLDKLKQKNFFSIDMSKSNQCDYKRRELDYKSKNESKNNDFKAEYQLCIDLKLQINDLKQKIDSSSGKPNIFLNRFRLIEEEEVKFKAGQLVLAIKDGGRLCWPAKIVSSFDHNFTVYFYIDQETATLRRDQMQKFNRKLMKTLFKKVNFKQLDTAFTRIKQDSELILKDKEKQLFIILDSKILRKKNRSLKDLNKTKCSIIRKVNRFKSHSLLAQLDANATHLLDIQNKSLNKNKAQCRREVRQQQQEIKSDDDVNMVESSEWSKESLDELIQKQFKTNINLREIFKDCRPETIDLKELFANTNQ